MDRNLQASSSSVWPPVAGNSVTKGERWPCTRRPCKQDGTTILLLAAMMRREGGKEGGRVIGEENDEGGREGGKDDRAYLLSCG